MGFNINLSFGRSFNTPEFAERDSSGNWFMQLFSNISKANKIKTAKHRFDAVMNNPAVLINFRLISDLGSLGRVHSFKGNVINQTDFLYTIRKKPNYFQSWEQFFKDYYYWVNMGTAYLYDSTTANIPSDVDQLYWLHPHRLEFSPEQKKALGGLIDGKSDYRKLMSSQVTYHQPNGSKKQIPLAHVKPFFSLSNGLSGNWFEGDSFLDALYKIIANSDSSLDSLGTNLKYSQKFGVSAKTDKQNLNDFPTMGDTEKSDVEQKIASKKEVTVSKSPLNIEPFVKNLSNLKLDEIFLTQYFIIGKTLGIPRDVSEAYLSGGATFENQDKSFIKFISTGLQPLGDMLVAHFMDSWKFEDLQITWKHLPAYQSVKNEQETSRKTALENLKIAMELGLDDKEKQRLLNEIMQ